MDQARTPNALRAVCVIDRAYLTDPRPGVAALIDHLVSEGVAVHVIAASDSGRALRHLRDRITIHQLVTGPSTTWLRTVDTYFPVADSQVDFDTVVLCADAPGEHGTITVGPHAAIVHVDRGAIDPLATYDALSHADRIPRIADALRAPAQPEPRLGVVMLAHNALWATKRAVQSVLHHTTLPLHLVVVDNGSLDGTAAWLATIDDPRLEILSLPRNVGVAAGRDRGLEALGDAIDLVAFVDNDIEVLASWHTAFTDALAGDTACGIVGEEGAQVAWTEAGCVLAPLPHREQATCDTVAGFVMVIRRETLDVVGRFDESLGLFWHEELDFSMRAARLGIEIVRTASGTVLHFPAPSSSTVPGLRDPSGAPSGLADENLRHLAARHANQRVAATSPLLLVVDADAAGDDGTILESYGAAFTAADEVALVIVGIDADAATVAAAIEARAIAVGFDLEDGPRLIVMTPTSSDHGTLTRLADEVHLALGTRPAHRTFGHLGHLPTGDPDRLRRTAAAAWSARPPALVGVAH